MNALGPAVCDVAAHVAGCLVRWMRKAPDIEVIHCPIHNAIHTGTGASFSIDAGPLIRAVRERLIAIREHHRLPALKRCKGVDLPSSDSAIEDFIHIPIQGSAKQ